MKTLLLLSMLSFSLTASGQKPVITVVNHDSRPMPYAYVFVNGRPFDICNDSGKLIIPAGKLAENDTLSVSYLGTSSEPVIYHGESDVRFELDDTCYLLDDAVVEYRDIARLFRRSVNNLPQINYNCTMRSEFKAIIKIPSQRTYAISGRMEVKNEPYSKDYTYRAKGWFHHPVKFTTDDDTSNLSRILNAHVHFALNNTIKALELAREHNLKIYKPFYSYLGEKDNFKVFRIIFPEVIQVGFPFQIILSIDKDSRHVRSVELEAISRSGKNNEYSNIYSLKSDCEVYTHRKPLMNTVYLPVNLKYSFRNPSGFSVDLVISNPEIKVIAIYQKRS